MNNSCYLLESIDQTSLKIKIEELIEKNNFSNAIRSNYDLDISLLENALEDLDTYGFLSEKKVIIISNFQNITIDSNEIILQHLFKYLENPEKNNLLIICTQKLDDRKKIVKDIKKLTTYIQVETDPLRYTQEQLKNYKLETGVISLLCNYCKNDITKLYNECLKLKDFKLKEKEITKQDIESLVIEKLEDSSELTFQFSRSIAEKDKKNALNAYNKLLKYNIEPLSILGLLGSQMKIIYQVKVLADKHLSNQEISKILNEKSYRIAKTKELINLYSKEELRSIMIEINNIDKKIKTSTIDSNILIQLFILNL